MIRGYLEVLLGAAGLSLIPPPTTPRELELELEPVGACMVTLCVRMYVCMFILLLVCYISTNVMYKDVSV